MRAREARARGVQVHGDVPDHAVLVPFGLRVEYDRVVRTYAWSWEMRCNAEPDGSTMESRAIVRTTAAERASMRRHPWPR